jgi:hypothetical protein
MNNVVIYRYALISTTAGISPLGPSSVIPSRIWYLLIMLPLLAAWYWV